MALVINGLETGYGRVPVISDISMTVATGELVCLLGGNAAGKSTTLKAVIGLVKPWKGSIMFDGSAIGGRPCHEIVSRGIAIVPENRRLFPLLTVRHNLLLGAWQMNRRSAADRLAEVVDIVPYCREVMDRTAGSLSGGEQQQIAVARALMSKPKLLLMDEPSMGLAPRLVDQSFRLLEELRSTGLGLLVVEQNTERALSIADRCYILRGGTITLEGKGVDLIGDPAVRKAFLGI